MNQYHCHKDLTIESPLHKLSVIAVFSGVYINTSWLTGSIAIWAGRIYSKKNGIVCFNCRRYECKASTVNTCTGIAFKMWSNINRKTFTATIVCCLIIAFELGNAHCRTWQTATVISAVTSTSVVTRAHYTPDNTISIISKITFI